jgi:hypothetical protein
MHLFDNLDSGNGYKVRLLLAQLGISYRWTNLDLDKGETRQPEFLKRNPNGRIPTLELDDGTNLAESNATGSARVASPTSSRAPSSCTAIRPTKSCCSRRTSTARTCSSP